jgi:uncharacterized coiled-coil DUF342 family protein
MNEQVEFEVEEWQRRVDDLRVANERLREKNDSLQDAWDSLIVEATNLREQLKYTNSLVSRLRNHIAQGIEL